MTDSAEPIYPDIRLLYYLFDPETKEYLCLYSPVPNPYYSPKKNPESKPYMPLPSNVTDKEPLETAENQVTVFDKKTQKWSIKVDFRNKKYWDKQSKKLNIITEIGKNPAKTWTDIEPDDDRKVWDEESNSWIFPIEVLYELKIKEVREAANNAANLLKLNYSQAEFDTWEKQEKGARALQADPDSTIPEADFVRTLAATRGLTLDEMITKILNAAARALLPGALIIGIQQRLEDEAKVALENNDRKTLENIKFPDINSL